MKSIESLSKENEKLKAKLNEATNALREIHHGNLDGVIIKSVDGNELYSRENTTVNIILESITEAFISIDKNVRITYINHIAEEFFGIKKIDVVNKKLQTVINIPKKSLLYSNIEKAMQTHEETVFEFCYEKSDRWLRVKMYPSNEGLTIFFNDITDRHDMEMRIKDSEQKFRLLVESAKDFAIMMLDTKGTVISWNKGGENLLGYTEQEIIGKNFSIFFIPEDRKKKLPERELKTVMQNGKANDENWMQKKDGTRFFASGITTCVFDDDGKLRGLAKICRDVTVRRQLERQKDDFMSIASHELKTPVTSLKAYAQVLQTIFKRKNDIQSATHLAKMDAQLNKLTDLIGDLLDVTKIEAGKLQFNQLHFNFDELVNDSVESMQMTTTKHKLIKKGKTKVNLFSDSERISQVMTNLISNAIKYSPHTEKIYIKSSVEDNKIIFCVQDFGVGISKDKQKNLFQRFYRVSGPNTSTFPGLGLGLYISSEIIKRLGGRIWVESKINEGSIFCFSLPISKASIRNQKNTLAEESIQHE